MNVGAFIAFIACARHGLGQSLRQLANLQTVMAEGLTAARRLFAALDVEPEIREPRRRRSRCRPALRGGRSTR